MTNFKEVQDNESNTMIVNHSYIEALFQRINNLLETADQSCLQGNNYMWYDALACICRNISGFCTAKERELLEHIQTMEIYRYEINNKPKSFMIQKNIIAFQQLKFLDQELRDLLYKKHEEMIKKIKDPNKKLGL
jgi:hypothetical protein